MGPSIVAPTFDQIRDATEKLRGHYAASSLKPHDILSSSQDFGSLGCRIREKKNQFVFITTNNAIAALAALPPDTYPIIVTGTSVLDRLDLLLDFSKEQCILGNANCKVLFLSGGNPVPLTEENILRRRVVKEKNLQAGYIGPPSENGMAPTH